MYTILNPFIFGAAFAGAYAGMNGRGLGSNFAPTIAAADGPIALVAFAYARQYDTTRGAALASSVEIQQTQTLSQVAWTDRNPTATADADVPTSWAGLVQQVLTAVTEGDTVIAASAVNPPAPGFNNPAPSVFVNAAASPAATTQTVQTNVTVGASGTIVFGGQMGPDQGGASTAPATDVVEATPQLDVGALPVGSVIGIGASELNHACSIAPPLSKVTGLVPGSVHSIGYLMTDFTTPTNTFELAAAGVAGLFWWSP